MNSNEIVLSSNNQHTLGAKVSCSGVGLHTGENVNITLHPAQVNSGIIFTRVINNKKISIKALTKNVVETNLCTSLGNKDGVIVSTVEHLMSALLGCGVDNAIIEVEGPEVPIMDGSAYPFVTLIECVGVVPQNADRHLIRILKPISVKNLNASISLIPNNSDDLEINFVIKYENTFINIQNFNFSFLNHDFRLLISNSRTYGFESEVASLQKAGFAKGGSLDNAVVISSNGVLNKDGLRHNDEFVRHKILDLLGDLYLSGFRIAGSVYAECSGHSMTNKLLNTMISQSDSWSKELMVKNIPNWDYQKIAASA
ncbi:UDP-3-O-acyl-N-acetylglucosamine deacetylase [Alphaproteobacteria bacterium]|nr:UDP-3-O-acyl-N-acetylglucosamine deacetylase [Alphaproteobacteria bacterium]